jgi:predicted nucleic acid-binding protein
MARRLQEVIIDSSIAVKWFSEEEKSADALELRNAHVKGLVVLVATPLLACEVGNALRYKPDYDSERLAKAMHYLFKLHLREAPIDAELLARSSEIAFRGDVTIYDAIPVALAGIRKTRCVTADRETQYARLKPKGYPIDLL